MRSIENPSVEQALPGLIIGAIALVIAWPLAHLIGFASVIDAVMIWAAAAHYLALFSWYAGVFAAIGAVLRGTAMLFGLCFLGGNGAINLLGGLFVAGARGVKTVAMLIVWLLVGVPLSIAWDYGWKPIEDRIVDWLNGRAIESELRREYREHYRLIFPTFADFKKFRNRQDEESAQKADIERELLREYREHFRDEYPTFAEFKRAYYGQDDENGHEEKEQEEKRHEEKEQEEQQQKKREEKKQEKKQEKKRKKKETADPQAPLTEAYALLGLTESCTKAELNAQYRALMKKLHPDAGGTQALAAKLNQAKDLIIKQKGWK